MRLAILSDIHGNLFALDAVLAAIEAEGPFDALGVAGDLVEGGPHPRAVLERVRALGCPVVQGNNDYYLTVHDADSLRAAGKKERAIAGVAWARDQIGDAGVAYLAILPFSHVFPAPAGATGQEVLMLHANARDQETHINPDDAPEQVEHLLAGVAQHTVVFGHLHIPYVRHVNGRLLIDAASVGDPRDGDRRAAYAALQWDGERWEAAIRRVPYDLEATAAAYRASGMPDAEQRLAKWARASY